MYEFPLGLIDDYDEFFGFLRDQTAALVRAGADGRVAIFRVNDNSAIPEGAPRVGVVFLQENTVAAREYRTEYLIPRIRRNAAICLDFRSYQQLSPSFAHALMYEAVREAVVRGHSIFVANASDAVWSSLEQVQHYALVS